MPGSGDEADPLSREHDAPSTPQLREILSSLLARHDGAAAGGHYRGLCRAAAAALPVRGVSLSLIVSPDSSTLLASSDATSERLADLQFTLGEGPTHDAFHTGTPVLEPDLDSASLTRWPGFTPAALDLGIRTVFAFPLQVGAIRAGVLCLDNDRPGLLTAQELADVGVLVDACVVSVLNHLGDESTEAGWADEVGEYMSVVHQATGMIMIQLATTAERALLRLRGHAFAQNLSVAVVAAEVIARRLSFVNRE